ncbi:MAG: endo-1,4-beta-xylanase [Candidatus Obscuribacterales bacterium]|nr:endo-1,4-beta-xylanase [Candidatus Obscuribacterales bacterium]
MQSASDNSIELYPDEQLGVMLQLDNMLEKMPHHVWGSRRGEIDRQFELLEKAGVKWCRVGIPWELIQPKPAHWEWAPADYVVECAERHHVQLLWLLGNTATWDSRSHEWNGVPNDLGKKDGYYTRFVRQLALRYKGKIRYWEIRNEPNLEYMWHGSMKDYATYLGQSYRIIKGVDSDSQIVLGGLGGPLDKQLKFFRSLVSEMRKRGQLTFDIANFHVYAGEADERGFKGENCVAKYLDSCRSHIDKLMGELQLGQYPVWFTEFDYPANARLQPDPLYKGADGQGRIVKDMFGRLVQNDRRRKIFWASLLDDYNDDGFQSMGLIVSNSKYQIKKPRPAYAALKSKLNAR